MGRGEGGDLGPWVGRIHIRGPSGLNSSCSFVKGAELILNKVVGGAWIGNVIVMAGVPSIMQAMLDEVASKLKIGSVFACTQKPCARMRAKATSGCNSARSPRPTLRSRSGAIRSSIRSTGQPPTSNDDRCAGRGQSLRDAKSNSGVAAGDDRSPSVQVEEVHRRRAPVIRTRGVCTASPPTSASMPPFRGRHAGPRTLELKVISDRVRRDIAGRTVDAAAVAGRRAAKIESLDRRARAR